MVADAPPSSTDEDSPQFSPGYLRYALGLLTVVYIVNFVDRQILSILLESIKAEFGFSDLQLGLLGGRPSASSTRRWVCPSLGSPTSTAASG